MNTFNELNDSGAVEVPNDLISQAHARTAKRNRKTRVVAAGLSAALVIVFAGSAFAATGDNSSVDVTHRGKHRHHRRHVPTTTTTTTTPVVETTPTVPAPIAVAPAAVSQHSKKDKDPAVAGANETTDPDKINCDHRDGEGRRSDSFGDKDGQYDGRHDGNKSGGQQGGRGSRHGGRHP